MYNTDIIPKFYSKKQVAHYTRSICDSYTKPHMPLLLRSMWHVDSVIKRYEYRKNK